MRTNRRGRRYNRSRKNNLWWWLLKLLALFLLILFLCVGLPLIFLLRRSPDSPSNTTTTYLPSPFTQQTIAPAHVYVISTFNRTLHDLITLKTLQGTLSGVTQTADDSIAIFFQNLSPSTGYRAEIVASQIAAIDQMYPDTVWNDSLADASLSEILHSLSVERLIINSAKFYESDINNIMATVLLDSNASVVVFPDQLSELQWLNYTVVTNFTDETTFGGYNSSTDGGMKQLNWDFTRSVTNPCVRPFLMTDNSWTFFKQLDWIVLQRALASIDLLPLVSWLQQCSGSMVFGTPYVTFSMRAMYNLVSSYNSSYVPDMTYVNEIPLTGDDNILQMFGFELGQYSFHSMFPIPLELFLDQISPEQESKLEILVSCQNDLSSVMDVEGCYRLIHQYASALSQLPSVSFTVRFILPSAAFYTSPPLFYTILSTIHTKFANWARVAISPVAVYDLHNLQLPLPAWFRATKALANWFDLVVQDDTLFVNGTTWYGLSIASLFDGSGRVFSIPRTLLSDDSAWSNRTDDSSIISPTYYISSDEEASSESFLLLVSRGKEYIYLNAQTTGFAAVCNLFARLQVLLSS